MAKEDFIQANLKAGNNLVMIAKSSVASVLMMNDGSAKVTMKEKNQDGSQIIFILNMNYGTFTGLLLT